MAGMAHAAYQRIDDERRRRASVIRSADDPSDRFIDVPPLDTKEETAVADVGAAVADVVAAVADREDSGESNLAASLPRDTASEAVSIMGDTASEPELGAGDSAVAAVSGSQRRAPTTLTVGDTTRRHGRYNDEPEVGNFGLFFGNWGLRGTCGGKQVQKARRVKQDRQILKNPAQVLVVAEASVQLEGLLRQPAVAGSHDCEGFDARHTAEHWVVRGAEESAILIAARKDVTYGLDCLMHSVDNDQP